MNFKMIMPTIVFSLVAFCSYCLPVMQQSCAGQDNGSTRNQQIILVEPEEDGVFPENGTLEQKSLYYDKVFWGLFKETLGTKLTKRPLNMEMPLSQKLKWLEKYTVEFRKKVNDIVIVSDERERRKVERFCNSIESREVECLFKSMESIKLKLSKNTAEKLTTDTEVLTLIATAKYNCLSSRTKLESIEKFATHAPTLEAVGRAKTVLGKMLACCESVCLQLIPYHKNLLNTRKSELKSQKTVLVFKENRFYFQSREERDRELAEAQAKTEAEQQR